MMTQVTVQPSTAVNVRRLLQTAVEHELRLLRIGIVRTQQQLQRFEQTFRRKTSEFYQEFQAGRLGDDVEYLKWAGEYETLQQLQNDYRELMEARLC